jgi:hypothetical protein
MCRGEERRRLDTTHSVFLLEHLLELFTPHFVLLVHSHADLWLGQGVRVACMHSLALHTIPLRVGAHLTSIIS